MRYLALLALSVGYISGCVQEAPPEVQFARPATRSVTETPRSDTEMAGDESPLSVDRPDMAVYEELAFDGAETSKSSEPEWLPELPNQQQPAPRQQQRSRPDRPQPTPQPNLLTAGSLNDSENLPSYLQYLSASSQSGANRLFPEFSLGKTATISVVDLQGHGIPNAAVTVSALDTDEILMTSRTRADGKLLFVTRDVLLAEDEHRVQVAVRAGGTITKHVVSLNNSLWHIQVPSQPARLPHRLDVAFVIDTTGTMTDELEYLKAEIDHVASTLQTQFPDVEQRFALVCYRDHYDEYLTRTFDFADSVSEFRGRLSVQEARGGGDYPEAVHLGLEKATQLSWRTDNSARLVFLVGDAPPHRNQIESTFAAVDELRSLGVALYPLAGSGTKPECEFIFRAMACLTRGEYLFLTDHSGVGHAHEMPSAARFEVEPLNQLLVRVMAEELSGRSMLAQDVIAVEDGSLETAQVAQHQHNHHPHPHEHHAATARAHSHGGHVAEVHYESSVLWRLLFGALAIGFILWIDRRLRLS